jgi:hypothetical protein
MRNAFGKLSLGAVSHLDTLALCDVVEALAAVRAHERGEQVKTEVIIRSFVLATLGHCQQRCDTPINGMAEQRCLGCLYRYGQAG